jgi:hypothetical protein
MAVVLAANECDRVREIKSKIYANNPFVVTYTDKMAQYYSYCVTANRSKALMDSGECTGSDPIPWTTQSNCNSYALARAKARFSTTMTSEITPAQAWDQFNAAEIANFFCGDDDCRAFYNVIIPQLQAIYNSVKQTLFYISYRDEFQQDIKHQVYLKRIIDAHKTGQSSTKTDPSITHIEPF